MFGLNMNTDYFCFMAENEGYDELVSTRRAKLLAIAREIREDYSDYDEIDKDILMELCDEHNLDFYSLTQNDIDTINNAI